MQRFLYSEMNSGTFFEKQNSQKQQNKNQLVEESRKHIKSTSTNQHTHHISSQENLHIYKLQSHILELQKKIDQQQFQIQHFSEESNFYMQACEKQKQEIASMNIDTLKSEYKQQIDELIRDRMKIQQIISQLNEDYEQAYEKQEKQLEKIRQDNLELSQRINDELNKKQSYLSIVGSKDQKIAQEDQAIKEMEQRVDQLRHIERKFMIAMKEIERMKQ